MPLISTIVWTLTHIVFALGLNWLAREFGFIHYSEVISLYFVVLAARYYDAQQKFSIAYSQNPDMIEQMMRNELERNK